MRRSAGSIIGTNQVRYERMSSILKPVFEQSSATEINLYIDLYPIIRSLYSNEYEVILVNTIDIAAGIINMCGFYREFFRRFGVDSTIYLIAGYNCSKINGSMTNDYNRSMMSRLTGGPGRLINDSMKTNLKMLDLICPYLPDIHYVYTQYETSVCITGLLGRSKSKAPNLVISKDNYALPIPFYCNNTTLIRPKKHQGMDSSYTISGILDRSVFWLSYFEDRGGTHHSIDLYPTNITVLSAFSSFKPRSIGSILPINVAHRMLATAGGLESKCSPQSVYESNQKELEKRNISLDFILGRYHALDIPFQLEAFYLSSGELDTFRFENKIDPHALHEINKKYFKDNPLDLYKL